MKLLHIANLGYNPSSGMFVVIPQHVLNQSKFVDLAFMNISSYVLKNCEVQFKYLRPFKLENLSGFQRPDLVIFHGCYFIEYIFIGKELKCNNIPYIIIPHGSFTIESLRKKWLKKKIYRWLFLDKFVRNATAIQYLSQGELEKSVYKHPKAFIGTNGVDEHIEIAELPNDIKITYIGRLDIYYKGFDLLFKACYIEKDYLENRKVIINLYGPNENGTHQQIKQLIHKWDIGNIITVNDGVFEEEKKRILLESTFFIQTSRTEGVPMGILEALSYGLPCIVTKGTNLAEIIKQYDAGWTCETTHEDIAVAIKTAIEEKTLVSNKALNAKKLIHENYSWNVVAKKTIEYYKQIL